MTNPYTFLVIDDSYIDRLVSAMMIRHTFDGAEVFEMSSGQLALDWLQRHPQISDKHLVILLDIMMPQMNGFEFLVQFDKINTVFRDWTVMMLSSTLDDGDIRQAKNHPYVKKFLSKPLSPNQLKAFLAEGK
jgi:CheY-like chemotaxis protein